MSKNKLFKIGNTLYYKNPNGSYGKTEFNSIINLKSNTSTCSICTDPVISSNNNTSQIISLPCGHLFHKACIQPWYNKPNQQGTTCPMCRAVYNNPKNLKNILGRTAILNVNQHNNNIVYQPIMTLLGHTDIVTSIAYSPDGGNIASGSWDNSVKVWDVMSGVITATLKHSNHVDSVTYSPDGKYIASGSWDKTVKVWDAMSGAITATLKGHSDKVNSVAYSPDGQYIASWSDNSVKVWDVSNLLPQAGGKKNKTTKKEKLIDTYKKSELVKIANMNDVSLKMRNDKAKTKLQLFNSLKRKKLL